MLVLALDTATTDLVAGIVDGDRVLAETAVATRAHNETLMPEITRLLDQTGIEFADLGAVVVGCGPGPFTGLRVGMSTASALGQALPRDGEKIALENAHTICERAQRAYRARLLSTGRRQGSRWMWIGCPGGRVQRRLPPGRRLRAQQARRQTTRIPGTWENPGRGHAARASPASKAFWGRAYPGH